MFSIVPLCIFGAEVARAHEERREREVPRSERRPDCYASEPLCAFQSREYFDRGIRGAELVKSAYGWTVRSDIGFDNFAILAGVRQGTLDGTREDAERFAREWQAQDATRRYVWDRSGS